MRHLNTWWHKYWWLALGALMLLPLAVGIYLMVRTHEVIHQGAVQTRQEKEVLQEKLANETGKRRQAEQREGKADSLLKKTTHEDAK
jgi:fatty acid desaturase